MYKLKRHVQVTTSVTVTVFVLNTVIELDATMHTSYTK